MMIKQIELQNFRNMKQLSLQFSPHINLFYGANGAGKTSLLEALYYLAHGKSFRTHLHLNIIHHQADSFSIFALIDTELGITPIGIERNTDGSRRIRFQNQDLSSIASVTKQLPLLTITTASHQLFTDGPKLRRAFIDWGMFHVKHSFLQQWQALQLILKQRNAALKSHAHASEIHPWDIKLCEASIAMDQQRQEYISHLLPVLHEVMDSLQLPLRPKFAYYRGWSHEKDLQNELHRSLDRDRNVGYTQYGPHRADLKILIQQTAVQDAASQGQQKLIAYACYLAQGILLKKMTGQCPIYLIDDMPSELDQQNRDKVSHFLTDLGSQIFITGINPDDFKTLMAAKDHRKYHLTGENLQAQVK